MERREAVEIMTKLFAEGSRQNVVLVGDMGSGRPILVREAIKRAVEQGAGDLESQRINCSMMELFSLNPSLGKLDNGILDAIPEGGQGVLVFEGLSGASEQVHRVVLSLLIDREVTVTTDQGQVRKVIPDGWTTVLLSTPQFDHYQAIENRSIVLKI